MEEPVQKGAPYGPYGGKQGKPGDVSIGGSLDYSNHKIKEFSICKEQGNEKVTHLSFRTANFRDLLGIIIWSCAL